MFGQGHTQRRFDKARVAGTEILRNERGRKLGIEYVVRPDIQVPVEEFQVFGAGMHHLDGVRIRQHINERSPVVDGKRVDKPGAGSGCHLVQARNGKEGIGALKLGIDADDAGPAARGFRQVRCGRYPEAATWFVSRDAVAPAGHARWFRHPHTPVRRRWEPHGQCG